MSLKMSPAEREQFLAELHVGVISIAEAGRGPLTAPIWYEYQPGGELCVIIAAKSRKAALLKQVERFSLCGSGFGPTASFTSPTGETHRMS